MSEADVRPLRFGRVKAVANNKIASPAVSLPSSASTSPSSAVHSIASSSHTSLPAPPVYLPHRVTSPLDEEIVQPEVPHTTRSPPAAAPITSPAPAQLSSRPHRRQLSADSTPSIPLPSPHSANRAFSRTASAASTASTTSASSSNPMLQLLTSRVDDSRHQIADDDSDDESISREKTSLLRHSPSPPTSVRKPGMPLPPPPSIQLTPSVSLAITKRPGSPSLSPSGIVRHNGGHHLRRSVSVSSSRAAALNLHDKNRIPLSRILALSCYWFGWSFLWLPLLIVIVPTQAKLLGGADVKGAALSQILMVGSVVSVVAAPLLGSYSDSCTHPYGRRRPFMIVGTVLASVSLILLAVAPDVHFFSLSFALLSFANNMIIAPYSALVPDIVPLEQRGVASGYLGLFSMLGNLAGGMLGSLQSTIGLPMVYLMLLCVHGGCMWITCRYIVEEPLVLDEYEAVGKYTPANDGPRPPPTGCSRVVSLFKPFFSHDFRVVFFTRFVMQLGVLTVQEYLLYYLSDEIGTTRILADGSKEQQFEAFGSVVARSDDAAVTLLFGPVLIGAIFSSVVAGLASDWMGGKRKKLIYISGGIMCLSGFLFAVTRSYSIDLLLGGLFGLGFGAFSVLDWALAADVLPDPEQFAKDMGLWSLALVMPQVLAAPLAGGVLDACVKIGQGSAGYSIIFLLAALYFALGTVFVKSLEGVD